ncbi:killer toxin subunits alpha/beta [Verticillium alfalfae VaMs.102]|uniref:chitinase n=1 Tax=Verticillium alfalfae (strain VaMs.102 / ATCC MYA-4576 / FGSC 10136) TaxID=526221 RepID=C9SGR7_VERA1|nr:killer toxin subunits alpha/beta [Verticillium alfalfae VaMs.102]EEY17562.1 killer toxin subunits alpha/beta [Verticillium alfalfae VaMs.102]
MWSKILPLLPLLPATAVMASPTQSLTPVSENRILHVKTCPRSCDKAGGDLEEWSHFHDLEGLAVCPEPVLLSFNLYTPLDDPKSVISIRACTLGDASTEDNFLAETEYVAPDAKGETNFGPDGPSRRSINETVVGDGATCGLDTPNNIKVTALLSSWDADRDISDVGLTTPAAESNENTKPDVGRAIEQLSAHVSKDKSCDELISFAYLRGTLVGLYAGGLIDKKKTSASMMKKLASEMKGASSPTARKALEVCGGQRSSADTFGVVADSSGDFAAVQKVMKTWSNGQCVSDKPEVNSTPLKDSDLWSFDLSPPIEPSTSAGRLRKRADCRRGRLTSVRRSSPVSPVCCSSGTLPDVKPKPQADGSCATYAVEANEGCAAVAAKHGLKEQDLEKMNEKTWGWDGCAGGLGLKQRICVSSGKPAIPASYPDAQCGPTKPGSKLPTDGTSLADINPCPLKVCCNVWGNCGTTSDFCPSPRRPRATLKKQWDLFVAAKDYPKKILAFGGWAFSNEGPGAGLFRQAVSPGNREAFSDRVVKFAKDNGLSGLDFDWEYPGATDIEGSPPGQAEDGENYYQFLKLVRSKLPSDMTLSIAAASSYWYLRSFPIEKMAEVLDYIVYMTYDFHGQWDVGNKWAMPGCDSGTCLRSHVNSTTTQDSLVMITKAGVPTHKIVVGVTSYGRSFKMSDAGCRGPQCTFLGARNQSPAKKGRCTGEGGYISNFEIDEIIKKGGAIKSWYDAETDSDYLVYERVEWVAYMTEATKSRRISYYESLNMGGTSDWAVDLQGEGERGEDDGEDSDYEPDPNDDKSLEPCPYSPTTMDNIYNLDFRNEIPPHCVGKYLIPVLHSMLKEVKKRFEEILGDGYDKYFGLYADHIFTNRHEALWQLMMDEGNDYFNCEIFSKFPCCPGCEALNRHNCHNCINDCDIKWSGHPGWEWRKKKMPCPPDYSQRGMDPSRYHMESIFWDYKSDETKKDFVNEISTVVGVGEEDIYYPEHRPHLKSRLAIEMCFGSRPGGDTSYEAMKGDCQGEHWWHNAPTIGTGFTVEDVFNPKTEISSTLKNVNIESILAEYELSVTADEYDEDSFDLIDALVLPIFMMYSGLEHMETVVEMGKDIEEANKIALITNLLSAVLLVLGGFGGVAAGAASTGLRLLGRTLVALSEAGNTGLGLYTAVSDPTTIPLLIFGLIMSGTNLRSATNVGKAAKLRRDMSAEQIARISPQASKMAGIASSAQKRPPKLDLCRYA